MNRIKRNICTVLSAVCLLFPENISYTNSSSILSNNSISVSANSATSNYIPLPPTIHIPEFIKYMPSTRKRIVIDPGHYANKSINVHGAIESDIVLNIGKRLESLLDSMHYDARLTRTNGDTLSTYYPKYNYKNPCTGKVTETRTDRNDLHARADYASEIGADCLISLHCNRNLQSSKIKGMETYFYGITNNKQVGDGVLNRNNPNHCKIYSKNSRDFGIELNDYFISNDLKSSVIGSDMRVLVRSYNNSINHHPNKPLDAVLIELGYLSNPTERKFLSSEIGQEYYARLIAGFFARDKNVQKYFTEVNPPISKNFK